MQLTTFSAYCDFLAECSTHRGLLATVRRSKEKGGLFGSRTLRKDALSFHQLVFIESKTFLMN